MGSKFEKSAIVAVMFAAVLVVAGCQSTGSGNSIDLGVNSSGWTAAPLSESILDLGQLDTRIKKRLEKQTRGKGIALDHLSLDGRAGDVYVMDMRGNELHLAEFKQKIDDLSEFESYVRKNVPRYDSRNVKPAPVAHVSKPAGGWFVRIPEGDGIECMIAQSGYALTPLGTGTGNYDTIVKVIYCGAKPAIDSVQAMLTSVNRAAR